MVEGLSGATSPTSVPRARAVAALRRSAGALSTAATARMQQDVEWFRQLSAEERSWVGQIVQAGIKGFIDWYDPDDPASRGSGEDGDDAVSALAAAVFGAAPRELAGAITLQQTVDLVRLSIEVVEVNIDDVLDPADAPDVHAAVLRFAREVAFATAEVYARAAEVRGAWDARLEALVVDAVLRAEADETVLSRASALGWSAGDRVAVVIGHAPLTQPGAERGGSDSDRPMADLFAAVRRVARAEGLDALCAVQGDRLVVLLGGVDDPGDGAGALLELFGDGPVVIGPVANGLGEGHLSARAAISGYRAAPGWPDSPRPVRSDELLPERALAGDGHARRYLVEQLYLPLLGSRGALLDTVAAYLDTGGSVEATARALFVHANTVRYRLRQAADLTGFSPTSPREALTLQVALILGRQSGRTRGEL